jgi:hypothetical protein
MKNKNPGSAFIISLAVLMLLALQSVSAQTSPTNEATAGRFSTDVDDFMSVTNYAGIDMQKWLGYLRVENVISTGVPDLQAGLALKIKELYLGVYYKGQYSTGSITDPPLGPDGEPTNPPWTAIPTYTGGSWGTGFDGVKGANDFNVLIGFSNMGIKIGIKDETDRLELPKVKVADIAGVVDAGTYYYRGLRGDLTPSIKWGTTVPFQVGTFAIKPSAEIQFKIGFNQDEFLDKDSKQVYLNDDNNTFTPLLKLDSGGATLFEGDWGKFNVGIADSFSYVFNGEGDLTEDPENDVIASLLWKNTLAPYVTFSQAVTPALSFGAKLSIPLGIAWNNADYVFSLSDPNDSSKVGYLKAGVKYAFVEGKQADKLALLAGFAINLPEYKYQYNYSTDNKAHTWDNNGGTLQSVTLGAQFKFGPNALLDYSTKFVNKNGTDNSIIQNNFWKMLFDYTSIGLTVKY